MQTIKTTWHVILSMATWILLMNIPAMGQATAKKDTTTLSSVTVHGAKPFIQHRSGKIIVNVAESPVAAGGNAAEVIGHIPGVDGMQWHGRTLLVLIDGRSTGLKGEDLKLVLDAMPAGTIDRVELIEQPSAKYDAAGGAVLNIVTVKMKKAGVNGTLTTAIGAGKYAKFTEGAAMNYRAGKLNLYGGYDYLHGKPFYDYYSDRQVDASRKVVESTYGTRRSDNHSYRAGMDYDIDPKSSLGFLVKGMVNDKNTNAGNRSLLHDGAGGQDSVSTVSTTGHASTFIPLVNAWYKRSYDSTGKELNINANYLHYAKTWNEEFVTRYFDPKGAETLAPSFLRDHSPADNRILSFSADYVQPMRIGRFETGVKTSLTKTDNNIRWENNDGGGWAADNGKSNHFIYKENIFAAYLNYGRSWKKLELQLGMRAEQTSSEGRSITMDQVNTNHYLSFFPNLGIQYALSEGQQLGFSYRKGIERFGFDVVNPFVRYISQYSYSQGNPNIRPSISHNLALSYTYKDQLEASVSYGRFLDAPGTVFRKADTGNAVISSETNLGSADQLEADLSYSRSLLEGRWTSSNSISALYARYHTASDLRQGGARWTAMVSSDNVFSLGKGWKAQLSGMYYSPFLLGVYAYRSRFSMDLGVSKTVLANKGKLALNISDIFNTYVDRFDVSSYGIASYNRQKAESRVVRLVFTYKFGGKNQKNSAGHRTGIEDLRQRMGGN